MMKKLTYLVVLISIILFPSLVSAYELTCGSGPYAFNDSFSCTLKGANNIKYDVMKGTVESGQNVSCLVSSYALGISLVANVDVSNKFDLTGRSGNDEIVTFKCQVIGKLAEDATAQLLINDFTYHDSESTAKESTEIIRSNTFTLKKYDEASTKPVDNKPRDTSNSNSRLKGVSAEGLDFTFSSFITEYNIDVVYEVEEVELLVLPYNMDATYRIVGSQKLSVGDNTIDIYVTSPDGKSTTCYTLYIKRLPRGEAVYYPESDSSLKDLIISGQNIEFDKDTTEYTIHINYDVDTVDINAVPSVDGAKVNIANFDELKNGDIISIIVESQDGSSNTRYFIHVNKAVAPYDYSKILILGGVVVLAFILIILFIRSSKKSKEDPLLKIKNDKRTMNKGESFDPNAVPDATSTVQSQPAPNVIKADSVSVITPMTVDPNMVDDNRNKITSNVNTLDLNSTALPTQLPASDNNNVNAAFGQVPVNNVNQNIAGTNQEVVEPAPVNTLDLTATPVAAPVSNDVNIFDVPQVPVNQGIQPTGNPSGGMVQETVQQPQTISLDQSSVAIPVPPNNNQNQ